MSNKEIDKYLAGGGSLKDNLLLKAVRMGLEMSLGGRALVGTSRPWVQSPTPNPKEEGEQA